MWVLKLVILKVLVMLAGLFSLTIFYFAVAYFYEITQ